MTQVNDTCSVYPTSPVILSGSDGSAAGGGYSDLSEWPGSVSDAGVRAKESTGHPNRAQQYVAESKNPSPFYLSLRGGQCPLTIRARCFPCRHFPDPLGIVSSFVIASQCAHWRGNPPPSLCHSEQVQRAEESVLHCHCVKQGTALCLWRFFDLCQSVKTAIYLH